MRHIPKGKNISKRNLKKNEEKSKHLIDLKRKSDQESK